MSDIYLQITETPTVVTLSAPVVSGALASTVTVANTVTVALDSNSLSALENVTVTVGAAITGTVTVANFPATQPISGTVTIGNTVTIAGTVTANPTGTQTIAGTVTAMAGTNFADEVYNGIFNFSENNQMGVYVTDPLPTGTNRIGVVTIGAGTVTLGASTSQIGSVTASISGTVPVSISSVTVGNSITIGSLPLIGGTVTAKIGGIDPTIVGNGGSIIQPIPGPDVNSVRAVIWSVDSTGDIGAEVGPANPLPISGTVTAVNHQGTAVTTSNFTSTTASTTLASANASREVLTIFNEGAGNLHICAGATCTTIAYQVRLSAGDYYEVPLNQTSLTHSAVFATAGTARVTQVS